MNYWIDLYIKENAGKSQKGAGSRVTRTLELTMHYRKFGREEEGQWTIISEMNKMNSEHTVHWTLLMSAHLLRSEQN